MGGTPVAGWLSAAFAHQHAGRAAEAERVCRLILSVDPGHAQALHLLGLLEHQQGHSETAIVRIRAAIARDGRVAAFHHNLGNILKALDPAEARKYYERALALAPDSVDTLYNLGNTCLDLGQPERAIGYFERALRLRPDATELHNNLGMALQDLGRLDEAIACYRKALALRPDAPATLDNLAAALRGQGDLEAAQASYEQALALAPGRVESHIGLGVVSRESGRPQKPRPITGGHWRWPPTMPRRATILLWCSSISIGRRRRPGTIVRCWRSNRTAPKPTTTSGSRSNARVGMPRRSPATTAR